MADKEPRRRKKKRESIRRDDEHIDESHSAPQKNETKDSDTEAEENAIIASCHQPSQIAKIVFFILFSVLAIGMGSIFIALHGVDRGPEDIFKTNSHDEISVENVTDIKEEHVSASIESDFPEPILEDIISHIDESSNAVIENAVEDTSFEYETKTVISEENEVPRPAEEESLFEELIVEPHLKESSNKKREDIKEILEDIYEEKPRNVKETNVMSEELSSWRTEPLNIQEDIFTEPEQSSEFITEKPSEEFFTTVETDALLKHQKVDMKETEMDLYNEDDKIPEADNRYLDDFAGEQLPDEYENSDITNELDYGMKEKLDEIENFLKKSPAKALEKYENILQKSPFSPRANYGKSQALDKLAELQRSNKLLEDAISSYQNVMMLKNVPDKLYLLAGNRAVDRMRFRGFIGRSLKLLLQMAEKFPENIDIKNQLAVGYLLIGQNKEARKTFLEVLRIKPDSGFAKVHLGFILKTDESNYTEAIKLMSEGIATREPGVIDGRFYFHLGDALARTGKTEEAMNVYKEGKKEKLFLSEYQRSLYNVDGLTGRPWWEPEKTPYINSFKLLEKKWVKIKNEALALMNKKAGFTPESEGLQDTGDWKQFDLFVRGKKIVKNCAQATVTCGLVEQMPEASGCKRGQVKFSIMEPGTHVWAHTGPTNCRLRSHLGLIVPEGVSIRVATETRKWAEGKVILFDDSFEHEVWHNGSSIRLVLIVDFWHPELTAYQKSTLTPI